jgi:hypothetical protein
MHLCDSYEWRADSTKLPGEAVCTGRFVCPGSPRCLFTGRFDMRPSSTSHQDLSSGRVTLEAQTILRNRTRKLKERRRARVDRPSRESACVRARPGRGPTGTAAARTPTNKTVKTVTRNVYHVSCDVYRFMHGIRHPTGHKDRLRRSVSAEWPSPECGTVWELGRRVRGHVKMNQNIVIRLQHFLGHAPRNGRIGQIPVRRDTLGLKAAHPS